jgi:chromosome segregation ATPase
MLARRWAADSSYSGSPESSRVEPTRDFIRENRELRGDVREHLRRINEQEIELVRARGALKRQRTRIQTLEYTEAQLNREVQESIQAQDRAARETKRLNIELDRLQRQTLAVNRENKRLNAEFDLLARESAISNKEHERLQARYRRLHDDHEQLFRKYNDTDRRLTDIRRDYNRVLNERNVLRPERHEADRPNRLERQNRMRARGMQRLEEPANYRPSRTSSRAPTHTENLPIRHTFIDDIIRTAVEVVA